MVSFDRPEVPAYDEASYLILDEHWIIIGANEAADVAVEWGEAALVGQHAREVIGADTLARLEREGRAVVALDGVDHALTLQTYALPTGAVRILRAQEMDATLEHMVSLIVHELRNPLSAMRTLVQGLEEDMEPHAPARAYTGRLCDEIDRLGRLLGSMAQVARLQPRPPELLELGPLLERTAELYRPELARRNVDLRVHVTPRAGSVRADADQIAQVLVNLMSNAADAMPDGGLITMRARLDPRGRTTLQVEDTGSGMDAEQISQARHPRSSSKPGGMGLGLVIVRSIVRNHGGHMRLVSAPGRGTTVSVIFPPADEGPLARADANNGNDSYNTKPSSDAEGASHTLY